MDKIINAFKKVFNKRSLKYGSNSIILIAAVVVIAILVNVIVGMADLKVDLTSNKLFSLSDASKDLLKGLNKDVTIIGLFDDGKIGGGSEYKEVTDLLAQYEKYPQIKIEYIDPDKNPGIIKDLDSDELLDLAKNDFVVKSVINGKEKKRKLDYYDLFQTQFDQQAFQEYKTGSNAEQGFTGAIKYVTSEITPVVYFTTGHNEISVDSSYATIKKYLEENNYDVKTINLVTSKTIPEDAQLLVVASPKTDLLQAERDTLDGYLKAGGKAVFMFDYLANDPDFSQFNAVLGTYNVAIDYDKVKENDEQMHLPDDQYTMLLNVNSSTIIPQAFNVVLNNSRSVSILKNTKEYITPTSLIKTSDTAVGGIVDKARGENLTGPLDIAVAVENKGGAVPSKILVVGNAEFISDNAAQMYGNYYQYGVVFFIQSLNWMLDKKDDVNVPTKNYEAQTLNINQLQAGLVWLVLIIVFPLVILGSGLFVYLRRRHL